MRRLDCINNVHSQSTMITFVYSEIDTFQWYI